MTRTGRYELLRLIARGGMAEVFLARRRAAGVEKMLVVKRIRPERAGDARFLDLFVREASLSMSLAHQNIVPVFDFGRAGDLVFLAMERVEGKDLGAVIAKLAPMSPLLVAHIGAECARALVYAHERRSVVHRDVTPRNVLVSWSGEVKLTDFGIASLGGDATGALIGTAGYMAPEQARGEHVDARADLYALGLVLREALTGCKARTTGDALDVAKRNDLPVWPEDVDAQLRAAIDRATATAPDDRFPDARGFLAALDDFLVNERATKRGAAPEQQLAALLASGFADEPAEPAISPDETVELEPDEAIGTHTEHSLARTKSQLIAVPVRRRRWPYAVLALAAVAISYLAWPTERVAPVVAVAPPPAPIVTPAPITQPPAVEAQVAAPAPKRVVRPHVVAPPPVAPAIVTQRATINATPWAYFTVDGQDARHTTVETLELAVGTHRLHFWNPALAIERDATIDVEADHELRFVLSLRD